MTSERPLRHVAVLTLGCKLNLAESENWALELRRRGIAVSDRPVAADAYIINSCSVTHVADRKSRHLVRLARRLAPEATVVLTGCFAESAGPRASELGADLLVANAEKAAAVRRLLELRPTTPVVGASTAHRTRAFVKAQEGCNDVCAFCIVPRTRGRERSRAPAEVVREVCSREDEGYREVVITGTQLGAWGRDFLLPARPADLIRAVLEESTVPRVRFSSLQPQDIGDELLALWQDPRLCRHFHLALQSGCDATLRRMRRRYSIAQYAEALARIRVAVPDVAVTTDVMAGFPGESDAEFAESLAFCRQAGFAGMHVFPYSRRPGTTASLLPGHLPSLEVRARVALLLQEAERSARDFRGRFVGRMLPALWEQRVSRPNGRAAWEGLTDNYLRVRVETDADLGGRVTAVRLVRDEGDALLAVPVEAGAEVGGVPCAPRAVSRLSSPAASCW